MKLQSNQALALVLFSSIVESIFLLTDVSVTRRGFIRCQANCASFLAHEVPNRSSRTQCKASARCFAVGYYHNAAGGSAYSNVAQPLEAVQPSAFSTVHQVSPYHAPSGEQQPKN